VRKLALSSGAYPRYELARAIRHVALAGYDGIEIVADAPHGYPPRVSADARKVIRSTLTQNKLVVSNINAGPMTALRDEVRPSWVERDEILRNERLQHTLEAAKLATDLGGPTVSTLGGGEIEEELGPEKSTKLMVGALQETIAALVKLKHPPLLITPQPGLLVDTVAKAREIVDAVHSPHVGINVNTGLQPRGTEPDAAIREAGDRLRHVHLEDRAADEAFEIVVPGTGVIDFPAVFAALDEVNYDGWLTVDLSGADVHPDDAAKQAHEFLRQFQP
jgi:sugar phosphate isomerase/epimerase